jgi:hypothetical protein
MNLMKKIKLQIILNHLKHDVKLYLLAKTFFPNKYVKFVIP